MTGTVVTWLTQEAHDRLQHELDQLVAQRPVIAAEINARREEGDLKENGGYHAARDEQGKQEARIRQIQELLRTAQVGVPPADDGVPATASFSRSRASFSGLMSRSHTGSSIVCSLNRSMRGKPVVGRKLPSTRRWV